MSVSEAVPRGLSDICYLFIWFFLGGLDGEARFSHNPAKASGSNGILIAHIATCAKGMAVHTHRADHRFDADDGDVDGGGESAAE